MRTPPESPDAKRHRKNQRNESGMAQAKKAAVATSIIVRKVMTTDIRAAIV